LFTEPRRKIAIQFNGHEARGAGSKKFCDCTCAGADLNHCLLRNVSQSTHDRHAGRRVDEKILSEFRFMFQNSQPRLRPPRMV
jgi:hypothetical protein